MVAKMNFNFSLLLVVVYLLHINGHNDVVVHDPGGQEDKQVIACKPSMLNISCPRDTSIEIINGNFGRFTITLCNGKRAQNWSVNCYLDEAVVYMREECNGRSHCYIHPNVFTVEKDPCPGTERYLEAHYRCTPNQAKLPPWLISADSQDRNSKSGRVPITLPTSTTSTTTPTTTSTTTTTTSTTTRKQTTSMLTTNSYPTLSRQYPQDRYGFNHDISDKVRVNSPVDKNSLSSSQSDKAKGVSGDSSVLKPKLGARIRDDQHRSKGTESAGNGDVMTTETPSVVRVSVDSTGHHHSTGDDYCSGQLHRGVWWPGTGAGIMVSRQCPHGAQGMAERRCSDTGTWSRAHLDCVSLWMSQVSDMYRGGAGASSVSAQIIDHLYHRNTTLYGGDLTEILNLVDTSLKNVQLQTSSDKRYRQDRAKVKLLEDFSLILSYLLDDDQTRSWRDLSTVQFEFLRTTFLRLLQEVGSGVLESESETRLISRNFVIRELQVAQSEASQEDVVFGGDAAVIRMRNDQFQQTVPRNSRNIALLEIGKVDTVFSLDIGDNHVEDRGDGDKLLILSRIVSVFSRNVKNRLIQGGLNVTLKHLTLDDNIQKECVHWDIQSHRWVSEGNLLLASNATHSSCHFTYLSTYAIIKTKVGPEDDFVAETLLIVSLSAIFLTTLITVLCILFWNKIKVNGFRFRLV